MSAPFAMFHAPSALISTWVRYYWYLEARESPPQRFLPGPDVVAILSIDASPSFLTFRGSLSRQPEGFLKGPFSLHAWLRNGGVNRNIGIAFRHGGVSALLGINAGALRNRLVDVRDLDDPWLAELHDRLHGRSIPDMFDLVEGALAERIEKARFDWRERLAGGATRIEAPSVRELARRVGISERHLRRIYRDHIGLGPGELARITRARRAFTDWERGHVQSLTGLAALHGYADQAHLSREFRRLLGEAPSRVALASLGLSRVFRER